MAATKLNVFSGIRPRLPESLLPENAATVAQNCDFAYGELHNTKDGFLIQTMANAAKSLYTGDGTSFFSWTTDVNAVRSPIAKDEFERLYYTGDGGVKVTNRTSAKITGGPPGSSYLVGVPRPTVAPTLETVLPTINDETCDFAFKFHYEKGGIKYQDQTIVPMTIDNKLQWRFTPPAKIGKYKEYSSIDGFPDKGSANYIYKDTGTDKAYLWVQYAQVIPIVRDTLAQLPTVGASGQLYWVNGNNTDKMYRWDGTGYVEQGQKIYNSYAEFPTSPSLSYVYRAVGSIYENRYTETTFTAASTPETAFPVFEVAATKKEDGSQVFDVYTDNSSFAVLSGPYTLTMQKDESADSYTATLAVGVREADKETRAYVYTYANIYNEEGPPSDPVLVTTSPVISVNVTVTKDSISKGALGSYVTLKEIRIYRTPSGSTIADYFYVGSVNLLNTTEPGPTFLFLDDLKGAELNEPLPSASAYPPELDLVGLMALPNGIMAAWRGNELHFSEAYRPWAWPPEYVKVLPNAIVGAIANGSGAVVTTVANPYLLSGVSPDSMTTMRLNVDQAGVSKWSMAVVNGVCVYASNDGIVSLNGATASLERSLSFFTRDVWRERYRTGLSSMRFSVWDGRLIVFSGNGSFTPFMIRFDEADSAMTDLPNFSASAAFVSMLSDQCYYMNAKNLYEFNGGNDLTATWQSREMVLPRPLNFGIAQAMVEGNWSVEFWAYTKNQTTGTFAHQLFHTQALTDGLTTFRLPGGFESDRYRVKITGKGKFRELRVAQTARELGTV